MKKIFATVITLFLVIVMTVSVFAVDSYSKDLQIGFASINCELKVYDQTAGAFMYRDTTYSNFSYSLELHGYYVDPNTHTPVDLVRPDSGTDTNLEAYMSSVSYGVDLLGVWAQYSATYLSNPSYTGTLRLPY